MTITAVGDLAHSFQLRKQNVALKQQIATLTQELSTGRTADPGQRLSGAFLPLASIERGLKTLGAYETATAEAEMTTKVMQQSLTRIGDAASEISSNLLLAGAAPEATLLRNAGLQAHTALEKAVDALNVRFAGRSLFSGSATDSAALADADQIISALRSSVAGETTAEGVIMAIKAWFDTPGGGFETLAYSGSPDPAGPVRLSDGETLSLDITAADPGLRDMLRALATAALLRDGFVLSGNIAERGKLARRSGEQVLTAERPLTALRADIGVAQDRIETIQAENAAQTSLLEITRNELIGTEPYDIATRLEAARGRMEMLYTITARMARLSLADYLE